MKIKRFLLITSILAVCATLMAEVRVTGKLLSSVDNQPVEMATCRLFSYHNSPTKTPTAMDSVLVCGGQTDALGVFRLDGVKEGSYRLWFSSVGFVSRWVEVTVKDGRQVDMGSIRLREDVQALSQVDIQGHAAEMTVKGDTIEYNTSAYKVQEGAMVEDLLKKMNGVTVDKEGNVTVNGETIKAVRIDGKKFFGDDVQQATKNIPADMIDKIQVLDNKSSMANLTGFEDDETERIINLSLKKDRKKGAFGNFSGGLGADLIADNGKWFDYGNTLFGGNAADRTRYFFQNDFRYNANLFTNILLDESQTTIIGGANNINEIRSGRGRGFFGSQNQGVTWTENIGVNTNIDFTNQLKTPKDANTSVILGGDVQVGHSRNDSRVESEKESYGQGLSYLNNDSTSRLSSNWNTRLRLEIEYKVDSMNTWLFKPNISYQDSYSDQYNQYLNQRDSASDRNVISVGNQTKWSKEDETQASLNAIYSHKFSRQGRSLTLNFDLSLADVRGKGRTQAIDDVMGDTTVNQNSISRNNTYGYGVKASWVEPLFANNHLLEIALGMNGKHRYSSKDQYLGEEQVLLDSAYSNQFRNEFFNENIELNYRWLEKAYDLSVGAKVSPSQMHSRTTYMDQSHLHDTLINVWNFSPSLRFKYKIGKKEFARIVYSGTTNQPTVSQMEPVRNNSDAMHETVGNINLKPAFASNLRLMYSKFNQDNFFSLMTGIRGEVTKDALVNNSIYDETGKRYSQTVNAGSRVPWNIGGDLMLNVPFANKMMQFHSRTAVQYNQQVAYVLREQQQEDIIAALNANQMMLGDLSLTGNVRLQENINLRLTHQVLDVGIRGDITYSRSQNSLSSSNIQNVFEWTVTGDVEFHLPKNWSIFADCGYTDRIGYQLDDVSELLLNAGFSKSWKNASLKLTANDLLNQRKNIVQVVGENYVQYQKFNTIPTYAMLTFTYKLNKMGNLKAKGGAGFMQEMIEKGGSAGMPPVGAPPMGPPPER